MELKRCKNGHSYDPSITPECPECAAMAKGYTVPLAADNAAWGMEDAANKTVKVERGGTVPIAQQPAHWAEAEDYASAGYAAEDYSPTLPKKREQQEETACQPVTGWLVCVEGAEKGRDYRLHAEMNYVGRGKGNDVVLAGDQTVSRERHALIAYDDRGRTFFFAPANGSSLVRQNGRPVLSTVELHAGDRLEIGSGIYLFVPLCGEEFQW